MAPRPQRTQASAGQSRGAVFVEKVLTVALAHLARGGFERLSIPAVAAEAGVNKTSVYRRWPRKEDLVREALGAAMDHVRRAPDTGDLRADLVGLARLVADFVGSPLGTGVLRVLFAEGGNPAVRALASDAYRAQDAHLPHAALARAVERGEIADAAAVPLVLFTLAGAIMHRVLVEREPASDAYLERLVGLVLDGAGRAPGGGAG